MVHANKSGHCAGTINCTINWIEKFKNHLLFYDVKLQKKKKDLDKDKFP